MDFSDPKSALSEAINYLGINLYKELSKEAGNVFFSPFSVSTALAMAFVGSSHETAKEMTDVLGYQTARVNCENIKNYFQSLVSNTCETSNSYTLNVANVFLADSELSVRKKFVKDLLDYFKALILDVDFVKGSSEAVEKANEWVKNNTNGMIPQLLELLDSNTKVVILNAIYFKGFWLHAFKEKSTFLQYFYNNGFEDEAKLVEMMHLKESFYYFEDISYKALELPYMGENLAMFFLLPNSRNGVGELENQISNEFLKNMKSKMTQTEVEVALPKLHLEYSKSLRSHFQNLGMKQAFNSGAHFDKISDNMKLLLSDIIHKAVLDVDEEGTKATAATAVMMSRYSLTHCPEFIIDHPFLFLIFDSKNDLIIFMGKVVDL